MEEVGASVVFIFIIVFLMGVGWSAAYLDNLAYMNRYECKDERIVNHDVVCYRYDLKEEK